MNQLELKKWLWYDQETGVFLWKISPVAKIKPWQCAGKITRTGYVRIGLQKKTYAAHRLAWLYVYGFYPENYIDHIDGNPKNNQIKNLRTATNKQNQENQKQNAKNTTGYRGVTFNKKANKYQVQIGHNGKLIYCGLFDTVDEAADFAKAKRKSLYTHETNRAN
jgi:hypothetical protein